MRILGIGRALPAQAVSNAQLEQLLDTSDEWIRTRTGIRERRIMREETVTSLALGAAREALADAGLHGRDLDMIIATTALGDDLFPSIACLVQQELEADCPCVDLHAACTGFIYALDTADAYIKSGKARNVLIISAEGLSRVSDWTDRGTCVLFGDGAGAAVVGPGEGLMSIRLAAQTGRALLYSASPAQPCPFTPQKGDGTWGIRMQGQEVFRFAVSSSARDLQAAAEMAGLSIADTDWVLLHQANMRILQSVRQRLGIDAARMPTNIHRLGNTSSASVPMLLYDLYHSGLLQPGHILALSAFGAGMTSGACLIRWDKPAPLNLRAPAETLFFA